MTVEIHYLQSDRIKFLISKDRLAVYLNEKASLAHQIIAVNLVKNIAEALTEIGETSHSYRGSLKQGWEDREVDYMILMSNTRKHILHITMKNHYEVVNVTTNHREVPPPSQIWKLMEYRRKKGIAVDEMRVKSDVDTNSSVRKSHEI